MTRSTPPRVDPSKARGLTRRAGHVLFWTVLVLGIALDLLSKHLVFRWLSTPSNGPGELVVWAPCFRLSLHQNPGGPFSVLSEHPWVLVLFSIVALVFIFWLYRGMVREGRILGVMAPAMIAAGAVGNLTDRLRLGVVRDFLDFYLVTGGRKVFDYPIFNAADVLITVGAAMLILELLRRDPAKTPEAKAVGKQNA
jgi:signal peptidase II